MELKDLISPAEMFAFHNHEAGWFGVVTSHHLAPCPSGLGDDIWWPEFADVPTSFEQAQAEVAHDALVALMET